MKKTLLLCSVASMFALGAYADKDIYVRADAGLSVQTKKMENAEPYNDGTKFSNTPVFSAGVGYKISDDVRAEIALQHRKFKYDYTAAGTTTTQSTKNYAAFLNGYYDFNNDSSFTPYLTAGLGVSRNKAGDGKQDDGGTPEIYAGKTSTNLAWNVGVGSKMAISSDLDLDIAYRYVDLGKIKKFSDSTPSSDPAGSAVKLRAHELTAGLVYKF